MRRTILLHSLIFTFMLIGNGMFGQSNPNNNSELYQIHITVADGPITIDGHLTEQVWEGAAQAENFWQQSPLDGIPATNRTIAKVTYDDRYLYIAGICYDDDDFIIQTLKRDNWGGSDEFGVLLDPIGQKVLGYGLGVNALGSQTEGLISAPSNTDGTWDNRWSSAVTRSEGYWTVEMAIADTCRLLNPFQPFDPDTNPRVTTTGFGGCGVDSSRALSAGELQQLGYPRGDPLVPGSSAKMPKLTEFRDPYTINQFGELEPLDATGFGDSEVTYFARAALIKDWERWHAELAYERSNDDSGSFGASSVQDSLELSLRWEPTPLWTVSLVSAYTMIDQASDIAVPSFLVVANEPVPPGIDNFNQIATVQRLVVDTSDNALSYDTASVSLTANRRLTARSSLFAALYWYRQKQVVELPKGTSFIPGVSSDGETISRWKTLTLWFGIDWHFDTIKL
jgi:hypothetical protein